MSENQSAEIRSARDKDIGEIAAIYGEAVLNSAASFELEAPTVEEMTGRLHKVVSGGYPFIAAEVDGQVIGFAYASQYHTRPAYRHTVECSIYLNPEFHGKGIGKKLLETLIEVCTAGGFRQMIAIVGDSGNVASIQVHRSLGFHITGTLHAVGYKHGRWRDTVLMQRALGEGEDSAP